MRRRTLLLLHISCVLNSWSSRRDLPKELINDNAVDLSLSSLFSLMKWKQRRWYPGSSWATYMCYYYKYKCLSYTQTTRRRQDGVVDGIIFCARTRSTRGGGSNYIMNKNSSTWDAGMFFFRDHATCCSSRRYLSDKVNVYRPCMCTWKDMQDDGGTSCMATFVMQLIIFSSSQYLIKLISKDA